MSEEQLLISSLFSSRKPRSKRSTNSGKKRKAPSEDLQTTLELANSLFSSEAKTKKQETTSMRAGQQTKSRGRLLREYAARVSGGNSTQPQAPLVLSSSSSSSTITSSKTTTSTSEPVLNQRVSPPPSPTEHEEENLDKTQQTNWRAQAVALLAPEPTLLLPTKYKLLLDMFIAVETVLQMRRKQVSLGFSLTSRTYTCI